MMSQNLRSEMRDFLSEWKDDLNQEWRNFFSTTELAFEDVKEIRLDKEKFPIFPMRKALQGNRSEPENTVSYAHLFKAFDCLKPNKTRVILLGEDPYPNVSAATGRAFEDGAWNGVPTKLRTSLKRIFQSSLAIRLNRPDLHAPGGWQKVRSALHSGEFALEGMQKYFDRLRAEGVLFLNCALTFTTSSHKSSHLHLWKPLASHILNNLTSEDRHYPVLLLLGSTAQRRFRCIKDNRHNLIEQDNVVARPHPRNHQYLNHKNPLQEVNEKLERKGIPPVKW